MDRHLREALDLLVKSKRCTEAELQGFSTPELKLIATAAIEYLEGGESLTLKQIEETDYAFEIPDPQTFIESPKYLGKELGFPLDEYGNKEGKRQFYDFWLEHFIELNTNPKQYSEVLITGGIGIGKTTFMNVVVAYDLLKVLALKRPQRHYNLMPSTLIGFAFFNILKDLAEDVGYSQFQAIIEASPFFNTIMHKNTKLKEGFQMQPPRNKKIIFKVGSRIQHTLGLAIFGAQVDEANFGQDTFKKEDEEKKSQVYNNYTQLKQRKESRFMHAAGHFLIGSSKRSGSDFLEKHIEKQRGKEGIMVIDAPQYVVKKCRGEYSGKTFKVLLGDATREPKILKEDETVPLSLLTQVETIPVEFKTSYEENIIEALRNISGKSFDRSQAFIMNRTAIKNLFDMERKSPWNYSTRETIPNTITISYRGTDMIQDYLIKENLFYKNGKLPYPNNPRFIAVDTGYAGDALGMAMCCKAGAKVFMKNGKPFFIPKFHMDFVIRVKGKGKGEHYPLFKTREFIRYLVNDLKVYVLGYATDGYQSVQMRQEIEILYPSVHVEELSMDRTDEHYIDYRNILYNEAIEGMYYDKNLETELLDLRHIVTGQRGSAANQLKMKVDHPTNASDGFVGRKDVADAKGSVISLCSRLDRTLSEEEVKEGIREVGKIDFQQIEKDADEAVAQALKTVAGLKLDELMV